MMNSLAMKWGSYAAVGSILMYVLLEFLIHPMVLPILEWMDTLLLLFFILMGTKQFRDAQTDGLLRFEDAFHFGMLVIIIPSLAIAIWDFVYINSMASDPPGAGTLLEELYNLDLSELELNESEIESLERVRQDSILRDWGQNVAATIDDPVTRFLMTLITTYFTGFLSALVGAVLMYRRIKA